MPFAVVGSTDFVKKNGKQVRARQYPWGIVEGTLIQLNESGDLFYLANLMLKYDKLNLTHLLIGNLVENEDHCDFVQLREALLRTNVEDLRERTHLVLYEAYRRQRLQQMGIKDGDLGPGLQQTFLQVILYSLLINLWAVLLSNG